MVLSALPSQSLSFAEEQSRVVGSTFPTQLPHCWLAQVWTPGLQIPAAACPHACLAPLTQAHPPFPVPSQLSSLPTISQESLLAGPTDPEQASQNDVLLSGEILQVWIPARQIPFPSLPVCSSQAREAPTMQAHAASMVLSGKPSQSLSSADEQLRRPGSMFPWQARHLLSVQVEVPFLQMPFASCPQGCVRPFVQSHPPFGVPSQSSSLLGSQVSCAAGSGQAPHSPPLQMDIPVAQVPSNPKPPQERVVASMHAPLWGSAPALPPEALPPLAPAAPDFPAMPDAPPLGWLVLPPPALPKVRSSPEQEGRIEATARNSTMSQLELRRWLRGYIWPKAYLWCRLAARVVVASGTGLVRQYSAARQCWPA